MARPPRGHRWRAVLVGLLMVAFGSGCSTTRTVTVSPPRACAADGSDCMGALLDALAAWQEAYNSRDPVRLRALYAPGALITDDEYSAVPLPDGGAVSAYFDDLAQRPTARMRWIVGNVRFFGDTAVRSGECEFEETVNGQAVTRPVRYSLAYQRIDNRWLIVLQHLTLRP